MIKQKTPSLEDRIRQIRAEADAFIDAKAEELAAKTPGVPLQVLRNIITNRSFGCQCQAILNLEQE
ncbi:hypothetical protein V1292_005132 [Bradyrhizobium sp. AZCC 1719]|uniref:hypothetical protein n=1 Tax=Bradyrhizobium sp. AZCC 1719 TaxID=3117028 RepID=UPI002FEE8A3D